MTEREMLRRITGLEIAVKRLQMAVGGMTEATEMARVQVVSCDRCGSDVDTMETCPLEDCPCGFPLAEIEE